nr:hypothetical protein [uncultured Psychroserpens sp.]
MKKIAILFFTIALFLSCNSENTKSSTDLSIDQSIINESIKDWDKAWESKDLNLALKHYANQTDWTNAFGARVQSKEELKELLQRIFNMDFVMAGENNYGENEITFVNDKIAKVRTQNIRKNQKWADGSKMDDRYINHLRIYQKIDGHWLITDHMISQAWPTDPK